MNTKQKYLDEIYSTSNKLLNDLLRCRREGQFVFRGVSRKIENQPRIARKSEKGEDISRLEFQYLYEFIKQSASYIGLNYDTLDYVACAQHYGIPTRLIDWTRDPFTALFFAINNDNPDDESYKIYYTNLQEHIIIDRCYGGLSWMNLESGTENLMKYSDFIELIKNKNELCKKIKERNNFISRLGIEMQQKLSPNGLIFFDPPMVNERLISQRGLFSIPQSIRNNDASDEIGRLTQCVTIRFDKKNGNNERKKLREYLDNMDYTLAKLFPDLSSIGTYVYRKLNNLIDSKNEQVDIITRNSNHEV